MWNVSKYGAFSGPYLPAFGLNTERYEVSLRIQSEWGKIRTRKNFLFGHFSYSVRKLLFHITQLHFPKILMNTVLHIQVILEHSIQSWSLKKLLDCSDNIVSASRLIGDIFWQEQYLFIYFFFIPISFKLWKNSTFWLNDL